jgi:hypothetical protein
MIRAIGLCRPLPKYLIVRGSRRRIIFSLILCLGGIGFFVTISPLIADLS